MSNIRPYIGSSSRTCLAAGLLLLSACSGTREMAEMIEVTGRASMRGNEPFTELVLQTSESNWYVLKFEDRAERSAIQNRAPVLVRVIGELFSGDWNGRAFAHIRVWSWEAVVASER